MKTENTRLFQLPACQSDNEKEQRPKTRHDKLAIINSTQKLYEYNFIQACIHVFSRGKIVHFRKAEIVVEFIPTQNSILTHNFIFFMLVCLVLAFQQYSIHK